MNIIQIMEEHTGSFVHTNNLHKIFFNKSCANKIMNVYRDRFNYLVLCEHEMEIQIKKFLDKTNFLLFVTCEDNTYYFFAKKKYLDDMNALYEFKNYGHYSYNETAKFYKIEDADFIFSDEFTKITNSDLYEKKNTIGQF